MLAARWRSGCPGAKSLRGHVTPLNISARFFCSTSVVTSQRQGDRSIAVGGHKQQLSNLNYSYKGHGSIRNESLQAFESSGHLKISEEVRHALSNDLPVVALESTIYTHGLPYPDNIALAIELEGILRNNGVVPATIGFLDGIATIGLSPTELSTLSSSTGNPNTMKVSRRDMSYIIGMGLAGRKLHGGTTVAATMYLAELAGIKVFATGGIGGVHRGGEDTMDVSADLNELGRTTMCVIASGCKSFLDIPRTLEYLETQGVTVATYSDSDEPKMPFPAFYTRDSGVSSPLVARGPQEAASIIYAQELLGSHYGAGFLLANPIPKDFAVPKENIDAAIEAAVTEAREQGIRGHANTPFILAHIKKVTEGKSVIANRALIKSNVQVAADVIKSYHEIVKAKSPNTLPPPYSSVAQIVPSTPASVPSLIEAESSVSAGSTLSSTEDSAGASQDVDVIVYGALAVDLSCDFAPESPTSALTPSLNVSNPAAITSSLGGVGHNVALAAHRAVSGSLRVELCSWVANDLAGNVALAGLRAEGLRTSGIKTLAVKERDPDTKEVTRINNTPQYVAFNDTKKSLVMAMADMSIFHNRSYKPRKKSGQKESMAAAKWAVIDGNLDPKAIMFAIQNLQTTNTKVLFEPVSAYKSVKLFEASALASDKDLLKPWPNNVLDIVTPNQYELAALHAAASKQGLFESPAWWPVIDALGIPSSGARDRFVRLTNAKLTDEGIPIQTVQLLPLIPTILTKLGEAGVLHTELLRPDDPRLRDPASAPFILSRTNIEDSNVGGVYMRLHTAAEVVEDVVSVNGAGDTFVGVLVAGLASGMPLDENLIGIAQQSAVRTLRSKESVSAGVTGILKTLS